MTSAEAEWRAEGRREAAPAAFAAFAVPAALALVSWVEEWGLLGLPPWIWLLLGVPALLLTIDLALAWRGGAGLVRSRRAAIGLLGVLVLGNLVALAILVAGLVRENTVDLTGGELLLTAFGIYAANVVVFGLLFWEIDAGGPAARLPERAPERSDFRFPQDEAERSREWSPDVWDYLYVSVTNSIAFSPTDAMPLSRRAKAVMALEAAISAVTILLVAARAVNVLGS